MVCSDKSTYWSEVLLPVRTQMQQVPRLSRVQQLALHHGALAQEEDPESDFFAYMRGILCPVGLLVHVKCARSQTPIALA